MGKNSLLNFILFKVNQSLQFTFKRFARTSSFCKHFQLLLVIIVVVVKKFIKRTIFFHSRC